MGFNEYNYIVPFTYHTPGYSLTQNLSDKCDNNKTEKMLQYVMPMHYSSSANSFTYKYVQTATQVMQLLTHMKHFHTIKML